MNFLEKVNSLPDNIRSFLLSNDSRLEIEKACFIYGINMDDISKITQPIGLMFVKDINIASLPDLIKKNVSIDVETAYGLAFEITQRIFNKFPDFFKDSKDLLQKWEPLKSAPLISEEEAWKKVLETEPWILEEEKNKEKELEDQKRIEEEKRRIFRASLVKMPLAQALKEYPELGEQLVTSNRVELKNFPEPVRPSIKNWLADYTFNLGNRKHNSMERNNYAFHGSNAKNLSAYDRQKLTYILRSFDEDSLVFVNKNTRQVVFEKENTEQKNKISNAQITNSQPAASTKIQEKNLRSDSNLKFSFPQKLPYEAMRSKQSTPPIVKKLNPIVRIPKEIKEEKKDERMLDKNVVNLKE